MAMVVVAKKAKAVKAVGRALAAGWDESGALPAAATAAVAAGKVGKVVGRVEVGGVGEGVAGAAEAGGDVVISGAECWETGKIINGEAGSARGWARGRWEINRKLNSREGLLRTDAV